MGLLTIAASILSVWHPAVNAFALMLLVIPVFNMLYHEIRRRVLLFINSSEYVN